ncbi:hypothetical protein LENED_001322 [Lentinula edodes]|uniref:Uncharacterized protein n=1 Tax=Lentinula edodes TaxID=5353 RepID=A0A1Q3DYL4_LENED|nr:hypothetical protein LENED_001322 [Lentinula edodes]
MNVAPPNVMGGGFHNFQVDMGSNQTPQQQSGEGTVTPQMLHVGVSDDRGGLEDVDDNGSIKADDRWSSAPVSSGHNAEYVGPGDEEGPQASDGESAVLLLGALHRRYMRVETVMWNYFTSTTGVLWIRWDIKVELRENQDLEAEMEKMKDCVGGMYERHVVLYMMFIDAPGKIGRYEGTANVYHSGGGPERLMADEYNDELRGNMIFGTNVRSGGGIGVDPNATRRADLLEWALGERYQRVRTVWWNFVATCENELCLQWRLIIELKDIQDIQQEVKSMEACRTYDATRNENTVRAASKGGMMHDGSFKICSRAYRAVMHLRQL